MEGTHKNDLDYNQILNQETTIQIDIFFNSTTEAPSSQVLQVIMFSVLFLIGLGTTIMNVFVQLIFIHNKDMRTNSNLVICSMSVTDFLAGLVTLSGSFIRWTNWFQPADYICLIYQTIDLWAAMTSLMHILAVNFERYIAIIYPLKYPHITPFSIGIGLSIIWIFCLGLALAYSFSVGRQPNCVQGPSLIPILSLGIVSFIIPVPFIATVCLYVHIVTVILKQMKFQAQYSSRGKSRQSRSKKRMMTNVSAIIAAWIFCWLPLLCVLLAIHVCEVFNIEFDLTKYMTMFYIFEATSYGNSLINPIIYFLFGRDFRKAAQGLICCRKKKQEVQYADTGISVETDHFELHL